MKTKSALVSLAAGVASLACLLPSTYAQSAEAILQKSRDIYTQLKSYADTGVVLNEYGTSSQDKHTFSTAFRRAPRHVLLDFHKQGGDRYVIWADPGAFHTWWKITGQQSDYPNPNNASAISLSGPQTSEVATKIPTMLYGTAFESAMLKIADPTLDGAEEIAGHRCHRVSGSMSDTYAATSRVTNFRKVTVWIDADSFLVRRMLEEFTAPPGQRSRVTFTFEPEANPSLDDAKFKFRPPR